MVTKKSKRFIKALQSFCMIDNIVIEKETIKERRVHEQKKRDVSGQEST